jgi:hypothetical protein
LIISSSDGAIKSSVAEVGEIRVLAIDGPGSPRGREGEGEGEGERERGRGKREREEGEGA